MAGELESLGFDLVRRIHTVLAMHFLEGKKQSEISVLLNMSTAKVNRLIKQGRELGMVQISINSPYQRLVDLEQELIARWPLDPALVVPAITDNPTTTLGQVGAAAASLLLDAVRDGDTIAISGGKAVRATIERLSADGHLDVNVVPMTGGVQGQHYTDVNHLATLLAERLGGQATLIHAPLFAGDLARERHADVGSLGERRLRCRPQCSHRPGRHRLGGGRAIDLLRSAPHGGGRAPERSPNSDVRGEFLGHLIDVGRAL